MGISRVACPNPQSSGAKKTVFIVVPMVAPMLGQLILDFYTWHYIFIFQIGFILLILLWFAIRQKETLTIENKKKFSFTVFLLKLVRMSVKSTRENDDVTTGRGP